MLITDGIFTCIKDVYCNNMEKCFSSGQNYRFSVNEIKGIILDWLVGINDNGHEHVVAMLESNNDWDYGFLNEYFQLKEAIRTTDNLCLV